MTTLTEQRQALRDQIWLAGPEHFDVSNLVSVDGDTPTGSLWSEGVRDYYGQIRSGAAKRWTACFVGHRHLAEVNGRRMELLLDCGFWPSYVSIRGWHELCLDGWCPGDAYDQLAAAGEPDRLAQWHVAVEWLDRLIKRGER